MPGNYDGSSSILEDKLGFRYCCDVIKIFLHMVCNKL